MVDDIDSEAEEFHQIKKKRLFKAKAKIVGGAISQKLKEFKERNSDENRQKRIKSRKLELQEQKLITNIHKSKQKRKGSGFLSSLGAKGKDPRKFGLQGTNEGFGAESAKMGNADFMGLSLDNKKNNKKAHQNDFSGFDSLFGGGGSTKTAKNRRKKTSTHKTDGLSNLF